MIVVYLQWRYPVDMLGYEMRLEIAVSFERLVPIQISL